MDIFENELEQDDKTLYVGVIGYSQQKFDVEEAADILDNTFDDIEEEYITSQEYDKIVVVSGLTNLGIPKIAYEVADDRGYDTVGIAPDEARNFEFYDVDEMQIVGKTWGDESQVFIDSIDVLVKIGGGPQSEKELEMAESEDISVIEFDL